MTQMFDIQLDYLSLINKGMKLLNPEGTLFFSTNSRRFIFDETLQDRLKVIEISHKTLPLDFHDPKIHRCWKISKK
jgi:23S rRNA G2069 N7-methylase RlmK/C1962 C5-methylase RlmI